MKLTIDKRGYNLFARNEAGKIVATQKTSCNPSALRQIIMAAEMIGEIDWENSQVAQPNPAAVALGRLGGSVKSSAKSAAVRANGAKGGRPKSPAPKSAKGKR